MPAVNPEILTWARETAGLSLAEAAHKIGLSDTKDKTGAEKLAALEAGEREPSRSQLVKMSERYRRSLLVFYLSKPPQRGDRGQDFRTLPNTTKDLFDADLDALIRDIKARQSLIKSLLEDEDAPPLDFIDSSQMKEGYALIATRIVSILGFNLAEFRARKNASEAFKYLRQRIERNGIFVLLLGDLGSYHTKIPVEAFRGFAIADPIAPFVVVNSYDAPAAWSFTALHEVVHLWLGTTGVSGDAAETDIEQFCNNVAGAILLPSGELNELVNIQHEAFDDAVDQLSAFATARNISRAMVAYSLYKAGKIERIQWHEFNDRFKQEWLAEKAAQKEKRQGETGGPNPNLVRRYHLGPALLDLVSRAISAGAVTPTKAGKILGVSPRRVERLLGEPQSSEGS